MTCTCTKRAQCCGDTFADGSCKGDCAITVQECTGCSSGTLTSHQTITDAIEAHADHLEREIQMSAEQREHWQQCFLEILSLLVNRYGVKSKRIDNWRPQSMSPIVMRCSQCDRAAAYIKREYRWWWFPKATSLCIDHAFGDGDNLPRRGTDA